MQATSNICQTWKHSHTSAAYPCTFWTAVVWRIDFSPFVTASRQQLVFNSGWFDLKSIDYVGFKFFLYTFTVKWLNIFLLCSHSAEINTGLKSIFFYWNRHINSDRMQLCVVRIRKTIYYSKFSLSLFGPGCLVVRLITPVQMRFCC